MKMKRSGPALAGLVCAATLALAAGDAWADAKVELTARDDAEAPPATFLGSSPISLQHTISAGSSSAFGSADLSAAVLKANDVSGLPFVPGDTVFSNTLAQSNVSFNDTFIFTSGFGGTAFLDWSFDGTITTNPDKGVVSFSGAQFSIDLRLDGLDHSFVSYLLQNGDACPVGPTFCTIGSAVMATGSLPILIAPGSFLVQTTLVSGAVLGDVADFDQTARLFLRLPDGAAIQSASNQLFATATPIAAIPEPESIVLMLVGLGAIAGVVRRRRPSAGVASGKPEGSPRFQQ